MQTRRAVWSVKNAARYVLLFRVREIAASAVRSFGESLTYVLRGEDPRGRLNGSASGMRMMMLRFHGVIASAAALVPR